MTTKHSLTTLIEFGAQEEAELKQLREWVSKLQALKAQMEKEFPGVRLSDLVSKMEKATERITGLEVQKIQAELKTDKYKAW